MEQEEEERSLRTQLVDAIKECRHHLEILKSPSGTGSGYTRRDNSREIAMLEIELRRLKEALTSLEQNSEGET
ncbi:MAG TPA: hypothetical protein VN766_02260 [Stellaceae bacterium]|jgi:hypothetical protein|nr:hypothetical protein [Stellaceae bacterium]